jgi:hypothetical protein
MHPKLSPEWLFMDITGILQVDQLIVDRKLQSARRHLLRQQMMSQQGKSCHCFGCSCQKSSELRLSTNYLRDCKFFD